MTPISSPISSSSTRLNHLDGLRGLAALFVMLNHAALMHGAFSHGGVSRLLNRLGGIFAWGHYAVAVFIVLSGYCLMLPVVSSGELRGGFRGFLSRRARRILPPYYAALVFSLLVAATGLLSNSTTSMGATAPWTPGAVFTHFFLVHNFFDAFRTQINPPLWTVATEAQIYLLFPAFLLVWRRFGMTAAVIAAVIFAQVLRGFGQIAGAGPQYLGLFAFGAAAALASVKNARGPFFALSGVAFVVFVFLARRASLHGWTTAWVADDAAGIWAATLLVALFSPNSAASTFVRNLLSGRVLVALGAFSYSLYLTHFAVLVLAIGLLGRFGTILGVVLAVGFAYIFHRVFERPFMTKPAPRTEREAEAAAIVSPAP